MEKQDQHLISPTVSFGILEVWTNKRHARPLSPKILVRTDADEQRHGFPLASESVRRESPTVNTLGSIFRGRLELSNGMETLYAPEIAHCSVFCLALFRCTRNHLCTDRHPRNSGSGNLFSEERYHSSDDCFLHESGWHSDGGCMIAGYHPDRLGSLCHNFTTSDTTRHSPS